jgi:hypothetical protein
MPNTAEQWVWFMFFAGGALGGWMIVCLLAIEFWRKVRRPWS